jgi:hypothetical protein
MAHTAQRRLQPGLDTMLRCICGMYVCMYACMHVHTHTYIGTDNVPRWCYHWYLHAHTLVYTCVCVCVCMQVCVREWMNTQAYVNTCTQSNWARHWETHLASSNQAITGKGPRVQALSWDLTPQAITMVSSRNLTVTVLIKQKFITGQKWKRRIYSNYNRYQK